MKGTGTIRLRFWIPVAVFGAFSLILFVFALKEYRQDERDLENNALTMLREILGRSGGRIEGLMRNGLDSLVEIDISDLSIPAEFRSVVLLDDRGIILYGSRIGWRGLPVENVLPAFERYRFLSAQGTRRPDIHLSSDREAAAAYQPVVLTAASGQIRPTHVGMIFADYDLSRNKARLLNNLIEGSIAVWIFGALLMLSLWAALNRWLTRPLSHLTEVVNRFSRGEYIVRSDLTGRGELVKLSRAFNFMADEVLRNSSQLTAVLNSATHYAIIAADRAGKIIVFNPGAQRMTGYTSDEVIGKISPLIWQPDAGIENESKETEEAPQHPVSEFSIISEFARRGKTPADEWILYQKNGAQLSTRMVVTEILDERSQKTGYLCMAEDITERKKTAEFIKNILECVDEGFIIIDRDFRILMANRAYSRMVERPLDEIIGRHCCESSLHLSEPCYQTNRDCAVKDVFETRRSHSGVYNRYDSKGRSMHIETKAYPFLQGPSGEVLTVIETLVDVTDKQKLEDQLHQSQKMEAVGQLAGGIAHDFNNILTTIIGYSDLVLMDMEDEDPRRKNIEHILEGSQRAALLTKDLLLFSRKQVSERSYVDLNGVIRKVENFLIRIIGEDITCRTLLHPGSLTVQADAHQLEQVLLNLATNSRDAMKKGGAFNIATAPIRFDHEFITAYGYGQPGMYAELTVSDTGSGMDKETQQRIFEPFFTTKETGKGTGLGLAVVYGIIEKHNGYINLYSEPDLGTTFKIYLPLAPVQPDAAEESVQPVAPGRGETILLAEDEPEVRKILKLSLESNGYRVIEADNGDDAVKKFQDNLQKISMVLLDVIMPAKNGRQAGEEIRSLRPEVKIVFISGYTGDIISEKGMLEADAELIAKPVSAEKLLRKVREVLDR